MALSSPMNITTKLGTLQNLPSSLLGWLVVAIVAMYLTFQISSAFSTKIDKVYEFQNQQVLLMQKMYDAQTQQVKLLEKLVERK